MLDAAAYANGLDRPLDEKIPAVVEAKQFGVKTIDDVLAYAMAHGHPAAATAAGPAAGRDRQGRRTAVSRRQAGAAGSGAATARPPAAHGGPGGDRAIAAVEAVSPARATCRRRWASSRPAAASRHALVAGPNIEQARDLAGMLAAAGFQTDTATTGKELLRLATRSPDYELALDRRVDQPSGDRHAVAGVAARPADGVAPRGADGPRRLFRAGRAAGRGRSDGQGVRPAARRAGLPLATRAVGHAGAAGVRRFRRRGSSRRPRRSICWPS